MHIDVGNEHWLARKPITEWAVCFFPRVAWTIDIEIKTIIFNWNCVTGKYLYKLSEKNWMNENANENLLFILQFCAGIRRFESEMVEWKENRHFDLKY